MNRALKFPEKSVFGEPAQEVAETGDETESAEDNHQSGFCVQPHVEEVADCAAHDDAPNENERELHRRRDLLREAFRLLLSRRSLRDRFIVGFRGHSGRAA